MATTTIENGHFYITTGTVDGNTITHNTNELVDIWDTKIDYNYDNSIGILITNISTGDAGDEKPTKVKDLKRITESLAVLGYLIDEDGNSAKTKRNNLLTLATSRNLDDALNKRALLVVWGTNTAVNEQTIWRPSDILGGAFIQKIIFSETGGYVGEAVSTTADVNPPERQIGITIQLVRGKDI